MKPADLFGIMRKHPDTGDEYLDTLTLSGIPEEATRKASEWERRLPYLIVNNPRIRVARFRLEEVAA